MGLRGSASGRSCGRGSSISKGELAECKRIEPNKADNISALTEIKATILKGSYDKVDDAKRILQRAEPTKMATHSRSYRRLLRVIGAPIYGGQSRNAE